jgi:hypothetical protein
MQEPDKMKSSLRITILAVMAVQFGASMAYPGPASQERIGPSSRRTAVVISEIMYRPATRSDGRNLEYVELYNSQPWFQDISGFRVKGDIDFTFPTNTVLGANSYLVLAKAPLDVQQVCQVTNLTGGYSGNLPGSEGRVRLEHRSGAVLLEVHYRDESPWPAGAAGTGHSIVLAHPSLGEGDPKAWGRSAFMGGSPGVAEPAAPAEQVVINEFRASGTEPGFIELFNPSTAAADISGCLLTDGFDLNRFQIPEHTLLDPGQYVVFTDQDCGFKLSSTGGSILLVDSVRARVVDAVRYGAQALPRSLGRHPNGSGTFRTLETATPGGANSWLHIAPVVINEVMYDPITQDGRDEYIELYNWTREDVDLSGWSISDGVSYAFPPGTVLKASNYLVVTKDTARLRATHSGVSSNQVYGNFSGTLGNGGERIALSRPGAFAGYPIVVDEVTYGAGGRWGKWSKGGGSSLELIHPLTDHRSPDSWADSDESTKAPWTPIEWTGVLTNYGTAVGVPNGVNVILMGPGECLLDNIEVLKDGLNVVSNGTFEAGLGGWTGQGNHSRIQIAESGDGKALKLTSSARGDPGPNRLRGRLTSSLTLGRTATLRAQARWLRGDRELLVRIPGNYLEAYGQMAVPPNLGTPGASNSRSVPIPPPAIHMVRHSPVLPGANEPIVISAQVSDSRPLQDVVAWYRVDPATNYASIPLHDSGREGDAVAGDGIFSGTIPAQGTSKLVAFYVTAAGSEPAFPVSLYPAGAPGRECLARVGEPANTNQFGTYRLWLTQSTADRWSRREVTSNDPLDVTFVYDDGRVIHGAGAYYAGSKYNPSYDSPTGRPCDYALVFPEDDLLLGSTDFRISWPGNLNSGTDPTLQAEQTCYKIVEELGVPYNHRRHVNFFVNGVRRNALLEDAQRPNGEYIDQWFPEDNEGDLYKIQVHYEPSSDAATQFSTVRRAGLEQVRLLDGANKPSYYRWNWPKRAVKTTANDYRELFELIDAANLAETNGYALKMDTLIDVDEWMRIIAAEHFVGNWDSFGYSDGSNMYFYKPLEGKWRLCTWDMDLGFVQFADAASTDIFVTRNSFGNLQMDPVTRRFFSHPQFRRAYLRALDEIVNGIAPRLPDLVNAKQAAFTRNGVTATGPSSILSYVNSRRTSVTSQMRRYDVPFAVATNLVFSASETVTLTGTASFRVESVRINSLKSAVTWLSATNWAVTLRLAAPTNQVSIAAYDVNGLPMPGLTAGVTVIYTGGSSLEESLLVINEWMASNTRTFADPADGDYDDWFEIYNPNGWAVNLASYRVTDDLANPGKFLFPSGISIPAHGHLLVWADEEGSQFADTGQVHVNFKLSRDAETLALISPSGKLLDLVQFADQQPDVSVGRLPDGNTSGFSVLPLASPGNYNQPPPAAILLQSARNVTGQLVLSWNSVPGETYQLEYKASLDQSPWVHGERTVAGSSQASFTVSPDGVGCLFFRVARIQP